jgi:pimeloyl-ACP methyl ester carboxylesterase
VIDYLKSENGFLRFSDYCHARARSRFREALGVWAGCKLEKIMAVSRDVECAGSIRVTSDHLIPRRELLSGSLVFAGALSLGAGPKAFSASDQPSDPTNGASLNAPAEARRIAYDRVGHGDKVLLISGFPQTRRSWNRLIPFLSESFEMIPADLPSFGDSGILNAPATTENCGRVFHEFVAGLGTPLHVVAHDFGAWVAYSWALLFPGDFKSLTLIDAGIPGITLTNDIQLSDYFRKWNFIFMMLPDLPAALTKGKEDLYVGWWYKNKVHTPGAVAPEDVAAYVAAYAREGRMDAAFDYCRQILKDMEFNHTHFKSRLRMPLLAVGGQYSIPTMGEALRPHFEQVTAVVIPNSGHFVPEEQPEALAKTLRSFLSGGSSTAS